MLLRLRRRPLILFLNRMFGAWPRVGLPPWQRSCRFSRDRRLLPRADAVVVHLPTWPPGMPLPDRRPGQTWIAWSMEARANCPLLDDAAFMARFDLRMTYQRDAAIWTPYLWAGMPALLRRPPPAKTERAPAVMFQSAGADRSGRYAFAAELMRSVKVDSYGAMLRNRDLGEPDRGRRTKQRVIGRYRFALALENACDRDYVTEKFFDPLLAGTVPVYRGSPDIAAFAPGEDCYVDAARFDTPAALGRHLDRLAGDPAAYAALHAWRSRPLRPEFLRHLERLRRPAMARLCDEVRRRQ